MANCVDPDQTPHSDTSDVGLHCLQRPTVPIFRAYYGSNILVIFCCLLLVIQVFCVQRAWFLTGLYINCCILLIVIY